MSRLKPFAFLIGLALIGYIVSTLNLHAVWDRVRQLNPGLFFLAVLAGTPEILFKALRLKTFVAKAKSHISVKHSLLAFLSGQPLAAVTPGKLGDVSRIVLLSRFGKISMPTALAVHAADRIYDLAS
ncbi:MAG TPA: lysylphosphatidylglycerol synthase transmembrane domain-containing protein, partial [bacterium]|nr:lysylphosphatidylglycerol synthase transmembrane domain-containing protein [bacterium]